MYRPVAVPEVWEKTVMFGVNTDDKASFEDDFLFVFKEFMSLISDVT